MKKIVLITAFMAFMMTVTVLANNVSAADIIEPVPIVCQGQCMLNDCYQYSDCKPLKGECKTGNCCEGKCTIVPSSDDAKVNYISDKMVELLKEMNAVYEDTERIEDVYKAVKADISTGATQYEVGENATIFAKVTELGLAVDDAFCDVLIFNSSQTEVDGFELTYIPNSRGVYSNTIPVPNDSGLYIVDVECFRPVNESHQWHYFSGRGNPVCDLGFMNESGLTETTIELPDVPDGVYQCHPDRWSQAFSDFEDGTFEEIRFIQSISNLSIWVDKNIGGEVEYTIVVRFYKQTDKGEMTLGAALNQTLIGTTPKKITFQDFCINEPFDRYSLLEVEFCAHGVGESGKDITIYFNSSARNSSFVVNAIATNYTVDFVVGGASELHVVDWYADYNASIWNLIDDIVNISVYLAAGDVWSYGSRTLTDYNQTLVWTKFAGLTTQNNQIIALINALNDISVADVWSYSGSINSNILNAIAQSVWNYAARYTHGIII